MRGVITSRTNSQLRLAFSPPAMTCDGSASSMCDKPVDELLEKAQNATGEERITLYRSASKRIHEEIIPSAMLFHLVQYARVSKRINFKPSILSTNEIPLEQITFR